MTFYSFSNSKQNTLTKFVFVALFSVLYSANLKKVSYPVNNKLINGRYWIKNIGGAQPDLFYLYPVPNGSSLNLKYLRQNWRITNLNNPKKVLGDIECAQAIVKVERVSDSDRVFLSTDGGLRVDLWNHTNDNNQKWYFCPRDSYWNIIMERADGSKGYLSTNDKGLVDLWNEDDGSGRQRWTIDKRD